MSIAITAWDYLFEKNFYKQKFEHRDSRLIDKQTKMAISVAKQLYTKAKGERIQSEDLGVVLSSDTGPLESISEYTSVLKEKGYVGINPSKFPNIMSSTSLSRIAIELKAKGPCVPLLSPKVKKQALIYAIEQITAGRCRAMMLIHITKENDCFGCFFENEISCHERNITSRLVYKK